jgi:hypothetical protein
MITIDGKDWKEFRIWVVITRLVVMGIPATLTVIFEFLFDNSENLLMWLDRKLPDPKKYNG